MTRFTALLFLFLFSACSKPKPELATYDHSVYTDATAPEPIKGNGLALPYSPPKARSGSTIYFELNSDRLKADIDTDHLLLAKSITVIGHACPLGSDSYNLDLSMRRAEAVARNLIKSGIPSERIRLSAKGESSPVPGDFSLSRRAEISWRMR
jgi:outer membrane protein OmpA-like peptidoglycan-associated protein